MERAEHTFVHPAIYGGSQVKQNMKALKLANSLRVGQRALLRDVRAGKVRVADILREPPLHAQGLPISELLGAQVRWGRVKVGGFLMERRIPESRLVSEMPESQREAVARALGDRIPHNVGEPREVRITATQVRGLGAVVRVEPAAGYAYLSPGEAKARARDLYAAANAAAMCAKEEIVEVCLRGHRISEVGRSKSRNCRACQRENAKRDYDASRPGDIMVRAEPFVDWLKQNGATFDHGLDSSHVRVLLDGGQDSIRLDTVDRALLNTPFALWELYPELYPEIELEVAA